MRLISFDLIVGLIYGCCAAQLVREFRSTPKESRRALQTVPLLAGMTAFCLVLIWKTHCFFDLQAV